MASSSLKDDEVGFSEINVTPLVDVVLVLLIIFMMSAPLIYQNSIKVSLPQAKSGDAATTSDSQSLRYLLDAAGNVYVNQKPIALEAVALSLKSITEQQRSEPVYIQADKATPHGAVIGLMDILKQAGLGKFALTVQAASAVTNESAPAPKE